MYTKFNLKRQGAQNNLLNAGVWNKMFEDLQYANLKISPKVIGIKIV